MKVGVGLYVNDSNAAVELYCKAFGLELGYHVKNEDGTFFHSELYKNEEEVLSVVESQDATSQENRVTLGMTFDNEKAVRKAYELLSQGGIIKMPIGPLPWSPCAAEVVDRFGVKWYLTAPQHRPTDDFDPAKF